MCARPDTVKGRAEVSRQPDHRRSCAAQVAALTRRNLRHLPSDSNRGAARSDPAPRQPSATHAPPPAASRCSCLQPPSLCDSLAPWCERPSTRRAYAMPSRIAPMTSRPLERDRAKGLAVVVPGSGVTVSCHRQEPRTTLSSLLKQTAMSNLLFIYNMQVPCNHSLVVATT